ncbi:MAG: transketolase [Bdellovibrionota bacterium]
MEANTPELIRKSQWLRKELFDLVVKKQKGHIPSSYSINEMLIALYYGGYVQSPAGPKDPNRDRVIISKGHAAMALYPILIDKGYVPGSETAKFTDADGMLRMYADPSIPGIESVTGSLGHGVGIACGYALAAKCDGAKYSTYVIAGDGECYEGSIWETALFAAHHKLNNFCLIVDRNGLCIMDATENCVKMDPLDEKFRSFGFDVRKIDGHRYSQILPALNDFEARKSDRPMAIIMDTVKGKGISFMEGKAGWHNKMMSPQETEKALAELNQNPIKD